MKRRRASVITVETIHADLTDDFVAALDAATDELKKVDCLDIQLDLAENAPHLLLGAIQRLFKAQNEAQP